MAEYPQFFPSQNKPCFISVELKKTVEDMRAGGLRLAVFFFMGIMLSNIDRASAQNFNGLYVIDHSASDNIDEAIEQCVSGMNFFIRPVARMQIKKLNLVYDSIRIHQNSSSIIIQLDGRDPLQMPADGSPVHVIQNGDAFDVNIKKAQGKLFQTFDRNDGQRINVYSFCRTGKTLRLRVVMSSPRLPDVLEYELVYRRQN